MKRALRLFSVTITSIILLLAVSQTAYAVPGTLAFVNGTPQTLIVCENTGATPINSYLITSDNVAGETLTWSVFLAPLHGTLNGFNATATSIVGNSTPSGLTFTPTPGYSGSDVIQIQVSNGTNSAFTQINVLINAAPSPSFTTAPGASTCSSTAVTYTTQSGGGINNYVWTVSGTLGTNYTIASGGTGSASSTVTLNWLTAGSQTVTVNYNNLSGCAGSPASNTTTVNARPTPSFTAAPGATICGGVNTTYTTQAGQSSYVWSVPGTSGVDYNIVAGGTGSGSNSVTLNWVTSGSKTVTVNYNNAAGCTGLSAASSTTNVLVRPVATFTTSPGANTCAGSSVTYTTQAGQFSYVWIVPGTSGVDYTITSGGIGSTNNSVTLTWSTPGSKTVQVNYSDVNGCTSASNATNTTTVIARPIPSFTSAPGANTCAGISVTYATQAGQFSYIWSVPGTAGTDYTITSGGIGGTSSTVTLFWITGGSKTVTVNYSNSTGCTGVSAASSTTLVDAVIPTFSASPGANTCAGTNVTYTTQTGGGINSYVWNVPGVSGTDYNITGGGTGSGNNTVTLNWVTPGNQTVTVNYNDISGCTGINPASSTTNVHARPVPSFVTAPTANSCVSNNVTYATQGGESAYVWSVPGLLGTNYSIVSGGTSGTNSTVTLNWLTTGSQTVTVNYTDVNGCTGVSAATNTTTVNALPVPTFTSVPPSSTICPGVSVTYTTQTGGGINNYTWSVPGTAGTDYTITAGGTGSANNSVTLTWLTPGSKTVTVNYANTAGCTGLTAASNTTTVVPSSASFTLSANPVCLGSATTFNSGQPLCSGNALSFNGSSSNASITPVVSTAQNNITLEAWVNWSGATGSNQFIALNGNSGTSGYGLFLPAGTGTLQIVLGSVVVMTSTATLTAGTMQHVAMVRNAGTWSVYLNGVQFAVTSSGSTPVVPAGSFWIGRSQTATEGFNGIIDEVKFWNVARTTGQIQADMVACYTAPQAGLIGNWPFSEGSGTTTADISGNGNTLTLTGTTWVPATETLSTYAWSFGDATTSSVNPIAHTYSATGTFTPTLTVTNSLGCTSSSTATVTVNAAPAAITGLGTGMVCTGATLSLGDASGTGTWTSSTPALAAVGSSSGVVTGYSPGTPTIYYTIPNGCQVSAVVTVNQTPTGISGIFSACTGGTTTLTNGYSGGIWSSSAPAVGSIGTSSGIVSALSPGTTTITYTLTGGCTATVVFTDNVVPVAIGGATTVCPGLTTTLTDATSGGVWSSSATGVATIWSGSGLLTGVSAGTTNISYIMSTGCYATEPFTVNPLPASITGTTNVCVGLSTTLGDLTAGGVWSSSTGAATIVGSTGVVTGSSAGTTIISYTLSATGCYSTSPFTVNALPAAITGTTVICAGSTTTLSDATGTGQWSSSNSLQATVGSSTGVVNGISGTPTITYTLPTGCLQSTVITVNPLPAAIGGTLTVCPGLTTTLSDASSGGSWVSNNTAVATMAGAVASGISAGTSTITYTLPTGCLTTSLLTVNPNPAAITGTTAICPGTSTTLANASGGGSWTSGNTALATVGSGTGIVTGVTSGNPVISYTLPTGCYAVTTETVNGLPAAITFPGQGIISPVAGTTFGFSGDGGLATAAQLESPIAAAFDAGSNIYVTTNSDNRVRKISPLGVITTFAGTGVSSFSGDAGQATAATFGGDVEGVAVDASGNVYIADAGNHRIRKVNTSGIITTIAGGGASLGDGGQATAAQLTDPNGLAFDGAGNLYIADGGGRIRKVNTSGIISTYAGSGGSLGDGGPATAAQLIYPAGVAVDGSGNVYVADYSGSRIRKINTSGIISTIAGNGTDAVTGNGGLATAAEIAGPYGVSVDGAGNIYIAEYDGSRARVINAAGIINPFAGNGVDAVTGNGSPATAAETGGPTGFAIDATGNVYMVEYDGNVVRTITEAPTLCTGSAITLSDATGGGSWSSSNAGVASIVSGTGAATAVAAGICNLTYTSSTGCTAVIPCSVNSTPASVTGTNNVCVGATDALSDATSGGLWSSSTPASGTVGSTTGIVTGIASGTTNIIYNTGVVYTMTGGCKATLPLTVNSTPGAITGPSTVCTGAANTITLSGTGGGTWSSSSTALATVGAGTGIVTGVSSGALTISYTTSPGSCFAVKPLTVNSTPPANTGTASVCTGLTTTLANGVGGGAWSSASPGNGSVNAGTGVVTGIIGGTTAVISYTLGTGCFANTTVTINQSPAAITGATNVCTGATTTLSNTLGGGTWASSNTALATIGTSGTVTGVAAGTLTITYTVGSCFVTYAFTVNQTPPAITGNPQLCIGVASTFTDGIGGGVWSSSNTVAGTIAAATGVAAPLTAGATNIIYTLPGGCTATLPATVNVQPAAIAGSSTVCTGLTTVLTDATGGGAWSSSTSAASIAGGTVTGVSAGTATISYTGAGGCNSILPMTVNPSPAAITGTTVVCVSNTTTLSDATFGGIWTSVTTSAAVIGSNSGIVTGVGLGTSLISYTLPAGCAATTTVTVNVLPTVFSVNGGGSYCSGGTGVNVGLSNSTGGINYQLYLGTVAVGSPSGGTGLPLSFGSQTAAGTYTVVATNPITGCSVNMSGSVTVSINPLPFAYAVTGGGSYCSGGTGVHVGLSGMGFSTVSYQLINSISGPVGSTIAGTGTPYDFGLETLAGTYTVLATITATGCSATMAGSVTVTINPLPNNSASYAVTGGGGYCAGTTGVHVGLGTLSDIGINYQLYNGGTTVGSPLPGTGSAIDFGLQTGTGTYTIVGTNSITGCSSLMTGSVVVSVNPLPAAFGVTAPAGAGYCAGGAGVDIKLTGSNSGISYQLYLGGVLTGSAVPGTGVSSLDMGIQFTGGTYTAVAANTVTSCSASMSGSVTVTVNPLPTAFTVTTPGGSTYCVGGAGQHVGLSGSTPGISYQLWNTTTTVGPAITGTGLALDFGLQPAATYSVVATNLVTSCTSPMTGSVTISTNPLPNLYSMSAGGSYCFGGTGVDVSLTVGSDVGISYQLYLGATATGAPKIGTGLPLDWGLETVGGTYTVQATNTATGCNVFMTGSTIVTVNPLPAVFTMTGGGNFCSGGTGVTVGLSGSALGVNYQLYNGGTPVAGALIAGTGFAFSFGLQTAAGAYTAIATSSPAGCNNNMAGSALITINPLPNVYGMTGGGAYCTGGTGVHVGLASSDIGINYQLWNGGTAIGSAVAGTGAALDFGLITTAATYTVTAVNTATTCGSNMSGSKTVSLTALPAAFPVSTVGSGSYCAGGSGVQVQLSASVLGVNYQLYRGLTPVGLPVAGTGGGTLPMGLQTIAGTYTVVAIGPTGCTNNMLGSATISINPLPATYSVTGGGGYCAGGSGINVGLSSSVSGTSYQLYRGSGSIGPLTPGTGTPLNFGLETIAGTYTVVARNPLTTCTVNMLSSAVVSVNALPAAIPMSGGGHYCSGGTGVDIGLTGSVVGVNYQLLNGVAPAGSPMVGTGSALDFGMQTASGLYTIVATNATTSCTAVMTGSATITIDPLPGAQPLTGGGSYCQYGTGDSVGLLNSATGILYQLYYNGVASAIPPVAGITGSPVSFGVQTDTGVYTVSAYNTISTCSSFMPGSVSVHLYAPPTHYDVSGGGSYCAGGTGVAITLSGSRTSTVYQLFNDDTAIGLPVNGTGAAINFGLQTAGGSYMVVATNTTTTCVDTMLDTASVIVNTVPAIQTLTGGGSYCPGGTGAAISLSGSETGVNYQLYNGTAASGSPVPGTTLGINFGSYTAPGVYTVIATNIATLCTSNMSGSDTIAIYPLPTVYAVTGGGSYCIGGTGRNIGLSSSLVGMTYQLYRGATPIGVADSGTGAAINFGLQTVAGIYTVVATNYTSTCINNMAGSATITINPLPFAYNVTGGGGYCTGGTGVHIGLSGSNTGTTYQLWNGGSTVGSPLTGTGGALDFGLHTATGTYTVMADNTTTTCTSNMLDSVVISINPLPTIYTVTAGATGYCAGGAGVIIYISGTDLGVNYQLYRGTSPIGVSLAGTGTTALDFGLQTVPGTYTVIATNTSTGCTRTMAGSASFTINPLPALYPVTGGGNYCVGGTGVHVGLASSNTGITYQLFGGSGPVGIPAIGTGAAVDFGLITAPGMYTVVATNTATGCTSNMTGSATIATNPLPVAYTVTGGGNYCLGGSGAHIGLSGSVTGINYRLYMGVAPVSGVVPGTGLALDFGSFTAPGNYTVIATNATTSCTDNMSGSATIAINPLPAAYAVSGGGNFCPGGTGVAVGSYGSVTGVQYQLYNGTATSGSPVAGTGLPINFGLETATGTYTVMAKDTATGCTMNMTGSATVGNYPLPAVYNVIGGGSYCAGGTGVNVGLNGSNSGITYQLFNGPDTIGFPVSGTGTLLNFGLQTATGTYTVIATNSTTTCTNYMDSSAMVSVNPVVTPSVTITSSASGDTACAGSMLTLTALPSNGGSAPTYQWMVNGLGAGAGGSYSYIPANGDVVTVQLTSSNACAMPDTASNTVTLNVIPQETPTIAISAVPGNVVCSGTTVDFTTAATSGGTSPEYMWKKNGFPIAGATGALYSYVPANGDVITCLLTSNYQCRLANSVLSNAISVEVDSPVVPVTVISANPSNYLVKGETVTFTATITNTVQSPTYQWYVDGLFVPGAVLPTYTDNGFTDLQTVRCVVTSGGGCAGLMDTSNVIIVHISTTGVQQVTAAGGDIQLVPNPNKGIFTLKGNLGIATDEAVSLEITDMLGQVIYNDKLMAHNGELNEKITLSNTLANGMYILSLRSANGNKVFHMVIEQ